MLGQQQTEANNIHQLSILIPVAADKIAEPDDFPRNV